MNHKPTKLYILTTFILLTIICAVFYYLIAPHLFLSCYDTMRQCIAADGIKLFTYIMLTVYVLLNIAMIFAFQWQSTNRRSYHVTSIFLLSIASLVLLGTLFLYAGVYSTPYTAEVRQDAKIYTEVKNNSMIAFCISFLYLTFWTFVPLILELGILAWLRKRLLKY